MRATRRAVDTSLPTTHLGILQKRDGKAPMSVFRSVVTNAGGAPLAWVADVGLLDDPLDRHLNITCRNRPCSPHENVVCTRCMPRYLASDVSSSGAKDIDHYDGLRLLGSYNAALAKLSELLLMLCESHALNCRILCFRCFQSNSAPAAHSMSSYLRRRRAS